MSTEARPTESDLDRTDELPRLDVAAYEASLKENQHGLSRTDTWTVEALRDLDELAESQQDAAQAKTAVGGNGVIGSALTVNVDRILKRIAELEFDIATAHEVNEDLEKRKEAVEAQREQHSQRIQALEAENARVAEHRALTQEMTERTERELRDQLQQTLDQLKALQSAHEAQGLRAEEERKNLQGQIAQSAANQAELREGNETLRDQLHGSVTLAKQRAESLKALQSSVNNEKAVNAQLTRQFAAKLSDYDKLATVLDIRNRTIDELIRARDDLSEKLQEEIAIGAELASEIAAAEEQLNGSRALLREREEVIARRDEAVAELTSEIGQLRTSVEVTELKARELQRQLSQAMLARDDEVKQRIELEEELVEGRRHHASLESEYAAAQQQIKNLRTERDALLPKVVELDARTHEVKRANLELAQVREELASVQSDAQTQIQLLRDERDALLSTSTELVARTTELEETRAESAQLREAMAAAHADAQAQMRSLSDERDGLLSSAAELAQRTAELERNKVVSHELREQLAATQATMQLNRQALEQKVEEFANLQAATREHAAVVQGLELAIRARDELTEQLQGQLQTARDERAIIAGQLAKLRGRVKSLTQEIFRRNSQIAELRADLAVHTEALAAIRRDVNRIGEDVNHEESSQVERMLEPIEHSGAAIYLTAKMLTIGRTAENDVCIPSKLVSRHHARLLVGPNGVIIEDAGSTNGCFVNGEQVKQHLMHDGDVLELGDLRYRLRARSLQDTRVRDNVIPIGDRRPST